MPNDMPLLLVLSYSGAKDQKVILSAILYILTSLKYMCVFKHPVMLLTHRSYKKTKWKEGAEENEGKQVINDPRAVVSIPVPRDLPS